MLSNTTQNLLRTQYYDDLYATSNTDPSMLRVDDYDFHRILFRPEVGVQSRELIQIQTILQAQLERFGKSAFRDGEAVFGGGVTLDLGVTSGAVLAATNLVSFFDRTTNDGKYVFDANTTTTRAHVLQFIGADEGANANYLIFKYQSAGTFAPGGVIQATDDATVTATFASGNTADVFNNASIASIDAGVYFVSGFFARVRKQTIVLNPFSARPSYRIGLEVSEDVLDELDDTVGESLLDPANNNAPGAHRLRVRLTLAKRALSSSADPNFIELLRVIDGEIQRTKPAPRFIRIDELNDILARRTHDESGDYLVRPFTPVIESDPDNDANFVVALGPGKAYVRGYEVETAEPTKLYVRKGRETDAANNRSIPTSLGNFVYTIRTAADQPVSLFGNTGTVDVHCVNASAILTSNSTTYAYSKIGTARVRAVETHTVPANTSLFANNTVHRLYFFDLQFTSATGNVISASQSGSTITLQLPIGAGVPNVNDALNGATIILGGGSSYVSGTFTVADYAANSTVGTVTLAEFLPTLPNANTTYRLLFQSKDVDAFATYDAAVTHAAPFKSNLGFQAEVDILSKRSGTPDGETFISDSNRVGLLYQIPEQFVVPSTLESDSATFTSWVKTTSNAIACSGNTDFTLSVSGTNYSLPTGNLTAAQARTYLVIFDQTADSSGRGRTLQFADAPGSSTCLGNVSVTAVGSTYNITFTYFNPTTATRSLVGYALTTVVGLEPRSKTLIVGNTTHAMANTTSALNHGQIEFHTLNATAGFGYSLKTPDVFRIRKVLYKADGSAFANTDMSTATDVTSYFTLESGQRDTTYEYSSLVAGPNASRAIRPSGRLLVIFDWFQHSGRGYCTVDSYLSSTNLTRGMTYDTIPTYTGRNGRDINLRDALDFRPARSNYDFTAAALVYAASDTTANSTYLTSTGDNYLIPVSGEEWLGSYEYYLARIDKIAVGFDGAFRVIEGQDAVSPEAPEDEAGALLLFQLSIPPYTLVDDDGIPTTVNLQTFDHKRYTMQDLSKVEDRVARLEYYTALNSLERVAKDESVLDASGNERFKNGILVDSFHGGDVGDVASADFTASIDNTNRELRSGFRSFSVGLAPDFGHSTTYGVTLVGDMAIPNYGTETFINQPLASHAISVNPFDVASFYGKMQLVPAVDTWKDTATAPAQVIDLGGPTEAWVKANAPAFTNWGEWDQTWSGVISRQTRQIMTPNWRVGAIEVESWDDVETQTIFERQGTSFEYNVTGVNASLGNRVIDVAIVHHMRERDIAFAADGLKPQANLYAFFDGVNVDAYVQEGTLLRLDTVSSTDANPFYLGQTVYVRKAVTGNVAVTSSNSTVTGSGSKFQFEVVPGQYVRITQGLTSFDGFVSSISSNTSLTLTAGANNTLAAATLYTLTPVTIVGIAPRYSGNTVEYTLRVARARQSADADAVVPYTVTAGSLRPEKHVNDAANTTTGALVIIPPSAKLASQTTGGTYQSTINVSSAVCKSGVVRSWNSGTGELRLDNDITDSAVTVGAVIRIVSGSGAGLSATVLSYNTSTQTATVDNLTLGAVANESIYSVGQLAADGLVNSAITAGRAGSVSGVFHLQGGSFPTGSRQFRLTDSPTNNAAAATSAAEANYQASGLSYTMQETSVSSRQLGLQRLGPRTESISFTTASRENFDIQYIDPLAETFLVDAKKHPQGVFLTSVDICFAGKPSDDIPVTVELRNVVNGYPSSSQIVPCVSAQGLAAVTLRPDQVTTTTAPSFGPSSPTHTRFTFDAPVHLLPGREYAIVIRSDSNAYTVYTAVLGETVIGSTAVIAKQPYAGSFFKSQNASTWTESPFEDLMFRLNRAVWTASESAPNTSVLVSRAISPSVNTVFDSIEFYPHDAHFSGVTSAAYTLDIKPLNAVTGDLTDAVAVRYAMAPNTWRALSARAMMQGADVSTLIPLSRSTALPAANTVDAIITLSTTSRDVAPFVDLKKINLLCVEHQIDNMGLRADGILIVNPGAGYLANQQTGLVTTTSGSTVVTGDGNTNFLTSVEAGDTIVVGGNLSIIVASVTNSSHLVATTNASASRTSNTYYTYGALDGNNAMSLTITGGNGTDAAGYAVVGRDGKIADVVLTANGSGYTNTPTVTIAEPNAIAGFTLTQTQASLSCVSEVSANGGNALTRYITRPVTLADDFDARDLVVLFDAVRPSGTAFHVYYKVLPGTGATSRFEDQAWRPMTMETPDSTVSTNYYQFKEFKFVTPNGRALDATTDTTDRFKVFAVKVVMAAENPAKAPRIANFRAMALDT